MKKKTYNTPATTQISLKPSTLLAGSPNSLDSNGNSLPVDSDHYDEDDIDNAV